MAVIKGSFLDTGYWTPQCERWFQLRIQGFASGRVKPQTATKWSNELKRYKSLTRVVKGTRRLAPEFLYKYLA